MKVAFLYTVIAFVMATVMFLTSHPACGYFEYLYMVGGTIQVILFVVHFGGSLIWDWSE